MTCIYCFSTGPFTDEHVVPAGLGGDDKDWLLKAAVCGDCNTKTFSPLEAKVMRASPLAMARLFFQTRSRNRGARTRAPSIQARVSYFDDPDTGLFLEQELGSGGRPMILPQIIVTPPGQMTVTAADVPSANRLVEEMGSLADRLTICAKSRDGPDIRFYLTILAWRQESYTVGETAGQSDAPRDAIWLEPLERPATDSISILTPRVFRRKNGSLTCRAASVADAARLLTALRTGHADLAVPAGTPGLITGTPRIHLGQLMDAAAYNRVLTKIAFNLCAHLFGLDAVRTSAFDAARIYARTGTGGVKQWQAEAAKVFADHIPRLPSHHLLLVRLVPPGAGQAGQVVVLMQFYGGPIHALIVAEGRSGLPACPDPILVVVDYEANLIGKLSGEALTIFAAGGATGFPSSNDNTKDDE